MALTAPVTIFGVHSLTLLEQTTFLPLRTFKVVGDLTLPFETDLETLYGGSNRFAWEAEPKTIKTDMAVTLKSFDNELFTYLQGATVVAGTAETGGGIVAATNRYGTSVIAATGLVGVTVLTASKANLKAGLYIIKAASATTIEVYAATDVDFSAGTALPLLTDTMKVLAATSITTGATVDVATLGITITAGAGTIAFTIGDTATFEIRPVNINNADITLGSSNTNFPRLAMCFSAQKKGSGEIFYGFAPKVQPAGFSIPLKEMAFATGSEKLMMLYDSSLDYVAKLRRVTRSLG